MEREPNVVHVRSTFERRREPQFLIAAIAVFMVVVIVKPWSFGSVSGSASGSPTASLGRSTPPNAPPAVTPLASASPSSPEDPNAMSCHAGDTEQVVLLERWPGNEIRSWIAATDVPASGPLDPRVARIAVFSNHVIGLGICAPRAIDGAVASGARILDAHLIIKTAGPVRAVDLGTPDLITLAPATPDAAVLYGAPASAATGRSPHASPAASALPAPVAWSVGAYAIAFTSSGDPSPRVRWLRIDILAPAGPG